MKTILFIPYTFSTGGGSEKMLSILINELASNYNITLIEKLECSTKRYDLPTNVVKLKSLTYSSTYIKDSKIYKRLFSFFQRSFLSLLIFIFPKAVYRHYIKEVYDYEISFNYLYSSFLVSKSKNKNSKKIMWIHGAVDDLDYNKYRGFRKFLYYSYYQMQNSAFMKADSIVAISESTKQSIFNLFPNFKDKVELIYNGYDFSAINDLSNEFTVEPSNRTYRLLSVGRLDENKNVSLQVAAVKLLVDQGIDIELFIAGIGDQENKLREIIRNANLIDRVFLVGFLPNPYPYFKTATLFLLSSLQEGFPTVIVESLSLGVPVVSTKVGGVKELINEGVNGFLADTDVQSYSNAINKALSSSFKVDDLKGSVHSYTKEEWTKKVIGLIES